MVVEMLENKTIEIFERFGPIVGPRSHAAQLREEILGSLGSGLVTILDFQNVETLNASFSDELIAKLVVELGLEKFGETVKIINASDSIKSVVNFVVDSRLKQL